METLGPRIVYQIRYTGFIRTVLYNRHTPHVFFLFNFRLQNAETMPKNYVSRGFYIGYPWRSKVVTIFFFFFSMFFHYFQQKKPSMWKQSYNQVYPTFLKEEELDIEEYHATREREKKKRNDTCFFVVNSGFTNLTTKWQCFSILFIQRIGYYFFLTSSVNTCHVSGQ